MFQCQARLPLRPRCSAAVDVYFRRGAQSVNSVCVNQFLHYESPVISIVERNTVRTGKYIFRNFRPTKVSNPINIKFDFF